MLQHDEFTEIPEVIREVTANRCRVLDNYVLMQTGENEYTALIMDPVTGKTTQLTFTEFSEYGFYDLVESEGEWQYTVLNECYTYSNCGFGSALDLPVMEGVMAHAAIVFTVYLMFLVVFRSLLFPFQKRK